MWLVRGLEDLATDVSAERVAHKVNWLARPVRSCAADHVKNVIGEMFDSPDARRRCRAAHATQVDEEHRAAGGQCFTLEEPHGTVVPEAHDEDGQCGRCGWLN